MTCQPRRHSPSRESVSFHPSASPSLSGRQHTPLQQDTGSTAQGSARPHSGSPPRSVDCPSHTFLIGKRGSAEQPPPVPYHCGYGSQPSPMLSHDGPCPCRSRQSYHHV